MGEVVPLFAAPSFPETLANGRYILDGCEPVICPDLMVWGKWMQEHDRAVAKSSVGDNLISTVFLGLDHSFTGGVPILFETMIFGGKHDQYQDRYSTWAAAEAGHVHAVELVRRSERWPWKLFYIMSAWRNKLRDSL